MHIGFAILSLMTLVLSPAMAVEEAVDAAQSDVGLAPSINDFAVPVPPPAEAAAPQPENLTSSTDVDLPLNEGLISIGPEGFSSETQPN